MVSRSPLAYMQRKGLVGRTVPGPVFDAAASRVHRIPYEGFPQVAATAYEGVYSPDRAEMPDWSAPDVSGESEDEMD